MATYLFIHGAWHARWAWEPVQILFPKEHLFLSLDLPGHGHHFMEFNQITLKTYVDYVIQYIRLLSKLADAREFGKKSIQSVPEQKITLVGHSMAGMIISQIAEIIPELIDRLVYVAAFVPENGENLLDIGKTFERAGLSTEMMWDRERHFIDLKRTEVLQELFFNASPKEVALKAVNALTPEPMQPFFDAVQLTEERFGSVKKHYLLCKKDNTISINDQERMRSKITCSVSYLAEADHSPFFSATDELVKALM